MFFFVLRSRSLQRLYLCNLLIQCLDYIYSKYSNKLEIERVGKLKHLKGVIMHFCLPMH